MEPIVETVPVILAACLSALAPSPVEVATGGGHVCVRYEEGRVACCGENRRHQTEVPSGEFRDISAGYRSTCGVRPDRSVACWGGSKRSAEVYVPELRGKAARIAVGGGHGCALLDSGEISCWGRADFGQSAVPKGKFSALTVGMDHGCALDAEGRARCWGEDFNGETKAPDGKFLMISAGAEHTCALRPDRSVSCWGKLKTDISVPSAEERFAFIASGGYHSCGLTAERTVRCWGSNSDGKATPPEGTFVAISAKANSTCGIGTDGTVRCWGQLPALVQEVAH